MEWVLLVVFVMGWVVGWIQATGKVNFLPLLVKPLEKVQGLESQLVLEKARQLVLQSELDSAQLRVQDSELELVRVKQKARLRESELEMALDLAHSKAMAKD
jgi:hypothetical protein